MSVVGLQHQAAGEKADEDEACLRSPTNPTSVEQSVGLEFVSVCLRRRTGGGWWAQWPHAALALREALRRVSLVRPAAQPNVSFMRQLTAYERQVHGGDGSVRLECYRAACHLRDTCEDSLSSLVSGLHDTMRPMCATRAPPPSPPPPLTDRALQSLWREDLQVRDGRPNCHRGAVSSIPRSRRRWL